MKKGLLFLGLGLVLSLIGCQDKFYETVTYKVNEPVFMSTADFRKSVEVISIPQSITNYGKICFYQDYLYISENEKGIHIIDNRNPSQPTIIGFIELMGNADLAIREGMLYADSYIDLVWFNIDDPTHPKLEGRLENVFPNALPAIENSYGTDFSYYNYDGNQGIIIGWELKEKTQTIHYDNSGITSCSGDMMYASASSASSNQSFGINGSMSRFTLYEDYLYTIINNNLSIFDISGTQPKKAVENIYIGYNIETIFSYKDNMFMGTPTGMVIYSVKNPIEPEYQSWTMHILGCDPVVVEDDIAYVTIHSGNFCGQNANELIILDVSNVKSPKHLVTYGMTNPKGLGIDNGTLFLCDDGLKIFNASDPQTLLANRLAHYSGMDGFDVIPFNHTLMMIADDGIYQYDYSDIESIKQLSKLPISK